MCVYIHPWILGFLQLGPPSSSTFSARVMEYKIHQIMYYNKSSVRSCLYDNLVVINNTRWSRVIVDDKTRWQHARDFISHIINPWKITVYYQMLRHWYHLALDENADVIIWWTGIYSTYLLIVIIWFYCYNMVMWLLLYILLSSNLEW